MHLIFAGSMEIATQYARKHGWKKHQWRYVQGPRDVAGRRDYDVHVAHNGFNSEAKSAAYLMTTARLP